MSPFSNQVLQEHEVNNPSRALYKKGRVSVDRDYVESKVLYIRRNYNLDVFWSVSGIVLGKHIISFSEN